MTSLKTLFTAILYVKEYLFQKRNSAINNQGFSKFVYRPNHAIKDTKLNSK